MLAFSGIWPGCHGHRAERGPLRDIKFPRVPPPTDGAKKLTKCKRYFFQWKSLVIIRNI